MRAGWVLVCLLAGCLGGAPPGPGTPLPPNAIATAAVHVDVEDPRPLVDHRSVFRAGECRDLRVRATLREGAAPVEIQWAFEHGANDDARIEMNATFDPAAAYLASGVSSATATVCASAGSSGDGHAAFFVRVTPEEAGSVRRGILIRVEGRCDPSCPGGLANVHPGEPDSIAAHLAHSGTEIIVPAAFMPRGP